jgi:predicted nuclease of predicted toxin-antitoxin system
VKLLFDHHLSHKLVERLADLFPESTQTLLLGLATADDLVIWRYAGAHGYILVSLDSDFYDLSLVRGQPPKLIWLRCGNSTVAEVEALIRNNRVRIEAFAADTEAGCLEIF